MVAIADNSIKHNTTTQVLVALTAKLETLEQGPPDKPPKEEEEMDLEGVNQADKGVYNPMTPRWSGKPSGASSSSATRAGGSGIPVDRGGEAILAAVDLGAKAIVDLLG